MHVVLEKEGCAAIGQELCALRYEGKNLENIWFKHILFFIISNIYTHIYIVYNKSWDYNKSWTLIEFFSLI